MYEVEVKLRTDHTTVRTALGNADARPVRAVRQSDTYYDAPDRSFAETDEALRIRRETVLAGSEDATERDEGDDGPWADGWNGASDGSPTTVVTYKGPRLGDGTKSRREVEVGVDDPDDTATILDSLGYDAVATVSKHRRRYALDDFVVTLDAVDGLGEFVEVETETDDETALDAVREAVYDRARTLGLDPGTGITESYLELLLEENNSSR